MKTLRLPLLGDTGIPLFPVLLMLILPLASSLLLGWMFIGKQVSHVPTAILDRDNSPSSRSLVRALSTNEVFDVQHWPATEGELENLLSRGDVAAAVMVPNGFSTDLSAGKTPRVLVFYDGTQMSMTSATKSRIAEVLGTVKAGYLLQVMEGKLGVVPAASAAALSPVGSVTRFIGNPTKNSPASVLEGILINIAQIAMAMLGVEVTRRTRTVRDLLRKTCIAVFFGCVALFLIFLTQSALFGVPFRTSVWSVAALALPFVFSMTLLGSTVRLILGKREMAIAVCGFLSITFLLSGYTFPVFAMPGAFHGVELAFPYYHFGCTVRNMVLIGGQAITIWPHVIWLCLCSALLIAVNALLLQRAVRRGGELA